MEAGDGAANLQGLGSQAATYGDKLPSVDKEEVVRRGLGWLLGKIHNHKNGGGWIWLALIVTLPFTALALASWKEGRFWLGSLQDPGQSESLGILGMSFMGDTMVWPFLVLVPGALVLLGRAADRVSKFFSRIPDVLDLEQGELRRHYGRYIQTAKRDLAYRRWYWGVLLIVAGALAGVMCAYNLYVCTPSLGSTAYESANVVIMKDGGRTETVDLPVPDSSEAKGERESDIKEVVGAKEEVRIRKWDAEPSEAPLSWCLARIWVFFYYGILPFILLKLLNIAVVLYRFCRGLAAEKAFVVRAVAPDGAGGLQCLTDASLSIVHACIPFMLMLAAAFFKEAISPSVHNYFLFVFCGLPVVAVFVLPLSAVVGAVDDAKHTRLRALAAEFNSLDDRLRLEVNKAELDREKILSIERAMSSLRKSYAEVTKIPVWPIDHRATIRVWGALLMPIALLLIEQAMNP